MNVQQFTQGIPQNLGQIPQQSFQQPQQAFVPQQPMTHVTPQQQQASLEAQQQCAGQWVFVPQPQQQAQAIVQAYQQPQAGQLQSPFLQGQFQYGQAPLAYAPQVQQELGGQIGPFAGAGLLGVPRQTGLAAMRKGPKNYARSDERIREVICECLIQDMTLDVSDVIIDVQKGCVSLGGTVPDRHMKYCIEDIVDKCWGVREIENDLHVQPCEETGLPAGMAGRVSMQSGGGFASVTGTGRGKEYKE